ncbi:PREDICTED: solute carrier family 35 member E1 homolog [Rhagoletis zephyria]|uniref:solute carrier family 35 member E1 homolog n=1 Tax=Rhagoletis zephyria TaxID=28612 RepID=UPI0008113652|nr:PREDICTED: solute carrier family 35 member E1 homolog [Rhagoletis zephyria]XP_036319439.1 solute carrier family 35 member E1 homolog [Rhagoletis pomonella]
MRTGLRSASSRHVVAVIVLCIIWYLISSSNNVIGKMVLNEFPFPMTVTMIQLCSTALYSGPFFNLWRIRKYQNISRGYYWRLIIPLALGKFLSSVTSHISLWKVPVSYAHTVKATMPLFTVILTRFLFREKQPTLVYLSLVPIITGVGIATLTEISFDMIGLISALISTMGFSLQNIFSKKVLKDTGMHHLRLLELLGKLALFMFLPIWFFVDSFKVVQHPAITGFDYRVIALLFTDGVLNWLQNVVAFNVLSLVSPLTYAVASASKRIFVIAVSLLILGNPVTWLNCVGMTLAIFGVLCYNRAKQVSRASETVLPLTQNHRIKYEPLNGNLDPYYQGAVTSSVNGFTSKRGEKQYPNVNTVAANSLLTNGNMFPNGSTTTTRLLFV